MRKNSAFLIATVLMLFYIDVFAENDSIRSVPHLEADEKIAASLEIVKGEKNKTLHVFAEDGAKQFKEILTEKRIQSFIIRNNGKFLFFKKHIGGGQWPEVFFYNGLIGSVQSLGNLPDYDVSIDGMTMFTYVPRIESQAVGVGILYDVITMHEIAHYDFVKELMGKYGSSAKIGFFSIGIYFNTDLNGFELLFDQYEEIGKLTCTGIITLGDWKFHFTERKKELLQIMGYKP